MFKALNLLTGDKIYSFSSEKDVLKEYTEQDIVVCPECQKPVNIRGGNFRRQHFFHKDGDCSCLNNYSEPETEEHLEGKLKIYEWLRILYPKADVDVEYTIKSTKQRADVFIIHPDGEKWVFEFQCARISSEQWIERHNLYYYAGIKDFWVLGESRHKHGKTKRIEDDETKHRVDDFARCIHSKYELLYFLDPMKGNLHILLDGYFYKNGYVLYDTDEETWPLDTIIIADNTLWNQSKYLEMLELEKRLKEEEDERKREEALKNEREKFIKARDAEKIRIEKEYTCVIYESQRCNWCDSKMKLKIGRFGPFWSCSSFPKCEVAFDLEDYQTCPKCGSHMKVRESRYDKEPFWGCSKYPQCDGIRNIVIIDLDNVYKGKPLQVIKNGKYLNIVSE